jgi:hypothetical protein
MQQLALNQSSYVQGNKRPMLTDALKAAYRSGDETAIAEAEYQYDLYNWECHPAGPKPTR